MVFRFNKKYGETVLHGNTDGLFVRRAVKPGAAESVFTISVHTLVSLEEG